MGLFYRRPAAGVFAAFIVFSLIGFFISGAAKIAVVTVVVATAVFAALLLVRQRHKHAAGTVAALTLALAVAFAVEGVYFDIRYARMAAYTGSDITVSAKVISQSYTNSYSSGYIIRVCDINGEKHHAKARLDCEYVSDLRPGYEITLRATAKSLRESHDDTLGRYSDLADGLILSLTSESEEDYEITSEHAYDIELWLGTLNRSLCAHLRNAIPGQAGELCAAILLGNRSGLSSTVRRDFSRCGVSHLLALSGLHMSIIVGLADFLLKRAGVHKTIRCALLPFFALGYLALTGFSLSACRAVGMLLSVYFAHLRATQSDGITSLFGSVALIILVSPASVLDLGLWLSMLATLGIILGLPFVDTLKGRILDLASSRRSRHTLGRIIKPILSFVVIPIASTIAATVATSLVVWLTFGRISLWSVITNPILSPILTLILLIGAVALCFVWCPPIFALLTWPCKLLSEAMLAITHDIAVIPGGAVSLRYDFAGVIIILMSIALAALAVVHLKRKWLTLLPIPIAAVVFGIALAIYSSANSGFTDISYLRNGKNEVLSFVDGGDAVIIDLSDGGYGTLYSGLLEAEQHGAIDVSAVVLTHYHQRHISSVYRLCCSELVERIYLPYPKDEREYNILWSLAYNAEQQGCEVVIYRDSETVALPRGVNMTAYRAYIKRSTHPTLALTLSSGENVLTYVGASVHESELYGNASAAVSLSDCVIFGAHGPKLKSRFAYSFAPELDCAVFSTALCATYFDFENARFPDTSVGEVTSMKFRLIKHIRTVFIEGE